MGAVAWVKNNRYEDKDAGIKKESLATKIAQRADLPVLHPLAKRDGVERKSYLNCHYPTRKFADDKGFSIWDFDLTQDIHDDQERESEAQLRCLVDRRLTFGDLPDKGYRVRLMCAYCNNDSKNEPPDPKFNAQRIAAAYRPKCVVCGRSRVVLLKPDPREGQLFAAMGVR
jgi:hypothetical protein